VKPSTKVALFAKPVSSASTLVFTAVKFALTSAALIAVPETNVYGNVREAKTHLSQLLRRVAAG
jgi:hypothetical protein